MEGHGERIDTEAVHGHAIDLKLFYSGTYESVKTGGKGNMNGRAFSQAEILDEMRLGEIGSLAGKVSSTASTNFSCR